MELMRELSLAPGVSGSEEEIANIITRELKDVADKIETDSMGNLIATKKGEKKAPSIMLAAHMDEIGLMVRYIDDNGFIKFSNIGGINDQMPNHLTLPNLKKETKLLNLTTCLLILVLKIRKMQKKWSE